MLLKGLYDYAIKKRLLDNLPFQKRQLHVLIELNTDGTLRSNALCPLTQKDSKGKEQIGQERWMPRFIGQNNGGKSYFLAESPTAILGMNKKTGKEISAISDNNDTKSFEHFWLQVHEAYEKIKDTRLKTLLEFKSKYLNSQDGKITHTIQFIRQETKQDKNGKEKSYLIADIGSDKPFSLEKATLAFSINGIPITLEYEKDPIRIYWFEKYFHDEFQNEEEFDPAKIPTLCLISGESGIPIARSHPKILGVPKVPGGYLVSFAVECPSFSSYGFTMGQNAPIGANVAKAYGLAMDDLLSNEDNHLNLGPISFCFWAKESSDAKVVKPINLLLGKAHPEQVKDFLKAPFAGIMDREVLRKEKLYSVAVTGNSRRIVVQYWLEQPLEQAVKNFECWWNDIQIISLMSPESIKKKKASKAADDEEEHSSPYGIFNLARMTLKQSKREKSDKLVGDIVVRLYRAAFENTPLPLSMLKPILDEFHSALVKNDEKKPTYPYSLSRFALIKLILIRNRKKEDDFMPTVELADTADAAYNLGRLLAVFASLQDKYHDYQIKGAGIAERYYGTASSAPASAFPLLCRLARHHLSKLKKEPKDRGAAFGIENNISDILGKFQPDAPGKPPAFPRILNLESQGRFALGFYQQKAWRPKHDEKQEIENNA